MFFVLWEKKLMWQKKNWLNGHELKGKKISKPDKKIQKTFFVWWKKLLMEKIWYGLYTLVCEKQNLFLIQFIYPWSKKWENFSLAAFAKFTHTKVIKYDD